LRSIKYLILIVGLMLAATGCGDKKSDVPSAEESMTKNKVVRILTFAVNAPFEFGAGTGVQGFDVEIGNEIGKALGHEVKWIKVSGYERMFEVLKEGQAEVLISSAAMESKKEKEFAFSQPYFETGDVIAHQRSEFGIKDLASLAGKKVGVADGRPGDIFMADQKTAANVSIKKYPTLDDALGALNRTEVDAVVGDEPFITYSSVNSYLSTNVQPEFVNKYKYAVAVRKDETELLKKINDTLERMKSSGELAKLEQTWIGSIRDKAANRAAGDKKEDQDKKAPKTINVTINKTSGSWNMDRLDGFKFVLEGASGKYESTPILTDGNRGNCKFVRPVPPGEYKLNISILKLVTTVPVPDLAKTALSMDLNIGRETSIRFK
jgi:ABC-type amino acid transport substrate-binding protein